MTSDVTGEGYFMEYKKVNTNNLSMLEYAHGSGNLDFADILYNEQKSKDPSTIYYFGDRKVKLGNQTITIEGDWTSGKYGGGLSFSGGNSNQVVVTGGLDTNITITAWIMPRSPGASRTSACDRPAQPA